MKQGTHILRAIMLILFIGVLAYFGVYIWNSLTAETATATLYAYTAEDRLESQGYFFREEILLSENSRLAEVLCAEGEKVGKGDPVVRIYDNAQGYEIQRELDEATAELDSLNYILSRTGDNAGTMELDKQIVDSFTALRGKVTAGDLEELSDQADELRSLIFRRDYTYNGSDILTAQIAAAQARVNELSAQANAAYEIITAPASGLYSSQVDGYEGVLTVDALEGLTPGGLTRLAGQRGSVATGGLGKIVTNSGWYFACNLSASAVGQIHTGDMVKLRFGDSNRDYSARIIRISDEENGMVTVTFFAREYAALLTGLRNQSVEIITGSATGFRVPKRAVRVDGNGTLGIYRVSGTQAEWVKIDILWEEEDFYLVKQAPKTDAEGKELELTDFEKATSLRSGDTVIIKGEEIYDGKVVG